MLKLILTVTTLLLIALPLGAQSLAPSSPAREHFYFAGRRVATDNFQNCQTVIDIIHNFPSSGGTKSKTLTTLGGSACPWQLVVYSPSMVSYTSSGPIAGVGTASINLATNAYTGSTLPRTGAVAFGGQLIRFIQAAQNHDGFYTFLDVANDAAGDIGVFNYVALTKYYKLSNDCGVLNYFCPSDPLTKAQVAAFLIRALLYGQQPFPGCTGNSGYPYASPGNTCGFTYSASDAYADFNLPANGLFPYVQKLKELNLAIPCSATNYCPNATVDRKLMAELVIRSMVHKRKLPDNFRFPPIPYFSDVPVSDPSFSYIQKLREQGITAGNTATTYGPSDPLQRFQMAIFLIRAFFTEP